MLSDKTPFRILIISYFFFPDKVVGALRTSYWYKKLKLEKDIDVEVITANTASNGHGIHIIEQNKSYKWYHFVKDLGLLWSKPLKKFIKSNQINKPDLVIISGSPFLHFGIGKYLKAKYGCKVVLDYRDPFAINPGFKSSKLKILIKMFFEKKFNKVSDGLITVNQFCGELIQGFDLKPNVIIQNGYDETIRPKIKTIKDLSNLTFCYTGKFYFDPHRMIKVFNELGLNLVYAGAHDLSSSKFIKNKGFVSYEESVDIISQSDVAIIQTYGEDFQSTTKIFDYIRCKRIILIISDLHIKQGSIYEELKGYPNVYWAKNDIKSIKETIGLIQSSNYIEPTVDFELKYSRNHQYKQMLNFIKEING